MPRPEIGGIAPFFIVRNLSAALSFYRDQLGFEITFEGPADDPFFGIVERGRAMIMLKDVGVDPLPNYKREAGARWTPTSTFPILMRWRRNLHHATSDFRSHSKTRMTGCVGSRSRTAMATFCSSVVRGNDLR